MVKQSFLHKVQKQQHSNLWIENQVLNHTVPIIAKISSR